MKISRESDWFRAREQTRWDEQIDRDSATGRLDLLFQEVESDSAQGLVHDWPPK